MSHPVSSSDSPAHGARGARHDPPTTAGPEVLYEEKLTASWTMWLLAVFAGLVALVALAPISGWAAVVAAVLAAGGVAVALLTTSTSVIITEDFLQVGRARIERRFVGEAEAFRGDDVRRVRGPELDGRAFMNFRVSVGPVVRIRITDPVDPTPYWLTSTRHPERIVEVLADRR
jgi:hypothetical protein